MVQVRHPDEIERDRRAVENEADVLMDEMPDSSPLDLAREVMAKCDVFDMPLEIVPLVAEVLRGRQSAWLRGRRWPEQAPFPGAQLSRTADYAQATA